MLTKSAKQIFALLLVVSSWVLLALVVLSSQSSIQIEQKTATIRLDADNVVLQLAYRDLQRQLQRPAPKCPEPEPRIHSCAPDPLAGDCAISYFRLMEKPSGRYTVSCGSSWVVRWKRVKQPVD